jgi:xylulose-5-phosphate/fructose-6-phosphate phosphoketolase
VAGKSIVACGCNRLIEHKQYIDRYGEDMPEIRNWKWGNTK